MRGGSRALDRSAGRGHCPTRPCCQGAARELGPWGQLPTRSWDTDAGCSPALVLRLPSGPVMVSEPRAWSGWNPHLPRAWRPGQGVRVAPGPCLLMLVLCPREPGCRKCHFTAKHKMPPGRWGGGAGGARRDPGFSFPPALCLPELADVLAAFCPTPCWDARYRLRV